MRPKTPPGLDETGITPPPGLPLPSHVRIPPGTSKHETRHVNSQRCGLWVLLNQAEGLPWPGDLEGPFYEAVSKTADPQCMYGRIHSGNNAQGGRASGMPFALVATAERTQALHAFGYRADDRSCQCPRAAYIWLDMDFPFFQQTRTLTLNLNDLMATGAKYVVEALLKLKIFMDESYLGLKNKPKAFTRRTDVNN